jgi:transcriptional regulator of acetoin/glycerol metabolism
VRELENAIEHAFVLTTGDHIDLIDLPVEIRRSEDGFNQPVQEDPPRDLVQKFDRKTLTRDRLIDILNAGDWNKAEAGRRLGLSRAAIWKYMKKWNIPMQKDA